MIKSIFCFGALTMLLTMVLSCEKEKPLPDNPFAGLHPQPVNPADTVNPASLVGLHRNVFIPKCAVPGCHDGHFEPDFRTVQSSFNTMVYAPVTKNNAANSFTYRVVPNDTAQSVLYERVTNCCFVNENDRMPQDNIGTPLPAADLANIRQWIMTGARDHRGQIASKPDLAPVVSVYFAINGALNQVLSGLDNRDGGEFYNPFNLPAALGNFFIAVPVEDDNTPMSQMQYNKLAISKFRDNFSTAQEVPATFFNNPLNGDQFWLVSLNSNNFQLGDTIYMRYRVNDGARPTYVEFPRQDSPFYYKSFWSFTVKP